MSASECNCNKVNKKSRIQNNHVLLQDYVYNMPLISLNLNGNLCSILQYSLETKLKQSLLKNHTSTF